MFHLYHITTNSYGETWSMDAGTYETAADAEAAIPAFAAEIVKQGGIADAAEPRQWSIEEEEEE